MQDFKFFKGEQTTLHVERPARQLGILNGYVTHNLPAPDVLSYLFIDGNGRSHESYVDQLSYNEIVRMIIASPGRYRLCAVCTDDGIVHQLWDGVEYNIAQFPESFVNNPNQKHFVELFNLD